MSDSNKRQPFSRQQRDVVTWGIACFVLILVICQLWLLTATMDAFLGGDGTVVWPAAIVSGVCFALNAGLLYYLYAMERT